MINEKKVLDNLERIINKYPHNSNMNMDADDEWHRFHDCEFHYVYPSEQKK